MSEAYDKLLAELRPLLDETTIISILSDYDLSKPQELAAARDVLLTISADVFAEEATGFNPSGLGATADDDDDDATQMSSTTHGIGALRLGARSSDVKSSDDGHTTTSKGSRARTFSSSMASTTTNTTESMPQTPGGGATAVAPHVDIFDGLGEAEKEQQLCDMFTGLKSIDITLALRKANGNAGAAIDHLLSLQLLEETGQRVKGVDGFYVADGGRNDNNFDGMLGSAASMKKQKKGGNKGKGKGGAKGKNKKAASGALSPGGRESPMSPISAASDDNNNNNEINEGERARHIELVSDRFQLSAPEVQAIYHRRGNSPGATIHEILENFLSLELPLGSTLSRKVTEQSIPNALKRYPWVPERYISAVFEMTSLSDDDDEILFWLANDYFEKPAYLKYNVAYSVKASEALSADDEEEAEDHFFPSSSQSTSTSTTTPLSPTRLHPAPNSLATASSHSLHLATSRDHSRAAANSAFRMGRSNPLYRQVGSFYAERSRAEAAAQRAARGVEASYLVDSRSTTTTTTTSGGYYYGAAGNNNNNNVIDLHGTTVADGTSIALDRTSRWWEGLRDRCGGDLGLMSKTIRESEEGGLRVVTGLGRHNSDGRSALRNAVFKALVGDGWKVEVLTGAFRVSGRVGGAGGRSKR